MIRDHAFFDASCTGYCTVETTDRTICSQPLSAHGPLATAPKVIVTGVNPFGGEHSQTDFTVEVDGQPFRVERWSSRHGSGEDWYAEDESPADPPEDPSDDDYEYEVEDDPRVIAFWERWNEEVSPLIEHIQREVFASVTLQPHEFVSAQPLTNPYCATCQLPVSNAIHVLTPERLDGIIASAKSAGTDDVGMSVLGGQLYQRAKRVKDVPTRQAMVKRIFVELLSIAPDDLV